MGKFTSWIAHEWQLLKPKSKVLAVTVITYALSMNINAVKDWVTPNLAQHPKLASSAFMLLSIVALIQKPSIKQTLETLLTVKQTSPTTAEVTAVSVDAQ